MGETNPRQRVGIGTAAGVVTGGVSAAVTGAVGGAVAGVRQRREERFQESAAASRAALDSVVTGASPLASEAGMARLRDARANLLESGDFLGLGLMRQAEAEKQRGANLEMAARQALSTPTLTQLLRNPQQAAGLPRGQRASGK